MSSELHDNFNGGLLDNMQGGGTTTPQPLKNATVTLVLGILSIVCCFCYGIPGLVLGIVAMAISNKPYQDYKANPGAYIDGQNMKAGRICALIGLILSSLYFLFIIVYIVFLGYAFAAIPMMK